MISNSLVSDFILANRKYQEKFAQLINLKGAQYLQCLIDTRKITKKIGENTYTISSSFTDDTSEFILYDNTIMGAYTDILRFQLEAIEELKEFVELKRKQE